MTKKPFGIWILDLIWHLDLKSQKLKIMEIAVNKVFAFLF